MTCYNCGGSGCYWCNRAGLNQLALCSRCGQQDCYGCGYLTPPKQDQAKILEGMKDLMKKDLSPFSDEEIEVEYNRRKIKKIEKQMEDLQTELSKLKGETK